MNVSVRALDPRSFAAFLQSEAGRGLLAGAVLAALDGGAEFADVPVGYDPVPPEVAMEFLRRKGFALSWNWWDVWTLEHERAFTVAHLLKADLLADIRVQVQRALDEGISLGEFKEKLIPRLQARGWWGRVTEVSPKTNLPEAYEAGSPWRLNTIFRTNAAVAYARGRYEQQAANVDVAPFWMYDAVNDERTRESHAALDGKVFRADDPIWETLYPPNDWNCRCVVIALSLEQVRGLGKTVERGTDASGRILPEFDIVPDEWAFNPAGTTAFDQATKAKIDALENELKGIVVQALPPAPRGLCQEFQAERFQTIPDLNPLLKEYAKRNPFMFKPNMGFQSIRAERIGGSGYMSTYADLGFIQVNRNASWHEDTIRGAAAKLAKVGRTASAADLLLAATRKIAKGEALTLLEEETIAALYHEIIHNAAKRYLPYTGKNVRDMVMETLTDLTARFHYETFLRELGGKAVWGETIRTATGNIGYQARCRNVLKLMDRLGIDARLIPTAVREIAVEVEHGQMEAKLVEFLTTNATVKFGKGWQSAVRRLVKRAMKAGDAAFLGELSALLPKGVTP